MDTGHFHIVDYVIFISILCTSVSVGLYHAYTGGKQTTASEYLVGDRKLGIFPIAMSLLASITSPIAMLGMPLEIYTFGIAYYYRCLGILLAVPVVIYNFIPIFYNLRLTSAHEYIELRFNRTLRQIASVLFIIAMTIYCSFVIYGPAIALRQVTGLNILWSVASIGLIGTFYTSIGGIKAVMWTDVVQCILMFIALCVICVKGTLDVGGISSLVKHNSDGNRLGALSFSFDPRVRYTFWGCSLAELIRWSVEYGIYQTQVQRYLSAPSTRNAQTSLLFNIPGLITMYSLCCYIGFILYSKYEQCDPFASKKIHAPDQIVPFFVMETTANYPGIAGLFVAGIYSGSLSTISSVCNATSAIILEDFIRKTKRWKSISEEKAAKISKIITLLFGLLCLTFASVGDNFSSSYNITIFSGTLGGIFISGLFFPWTTSSGALIGVLFGMSFGFWLNIEGQLTRYIHPYLVMSIDGCSSTNITAGINYTIPITDESVFHLYKVSYVWVLPFVVITTVTASLIASFITGANTLSTVDPHLLAPVTKFLLKKFSGYLFRQNNCTNTEETNPALATSTRV